MAQIAVTIVDPRGQRSAHLVETQVPVRELIPPIVKSLRMSTSAAYELTLDGQSTALAADKTLAACRIAAGAVLHLTPEKNRVLKIMLDKLYEEVADHVKEKAWDLAKEKLETLLQLDPDYPDPQKLAEAIARQLPPVAPPTNGGFTTSRRTPANSRKLTAARGNAEAARTDQFRLEGQAGTQPQPAPAQTAGKTGGCMIALGKWVIGLLVAGAFAVYAGDLAPGLMDRLGALLSPNQVVLGSGDVQVTLRWSGAADLDLHVTGPDGSEIWYQAPSSTDGGLLDVDANAGCQDQQFQPVENIYWPDNAAPHGSYRVAVFFYQDCDGSGVSDYEVTVKLDRQVQQVLNGQITAAQGSQEVAAFEY